MRIRIRPGRNLCTTLCSTSCERCKEPHHWHRCHMYGLGIYLADLPAKSHRYVRAPLEVSSEQYPWYKEQQAPRSASAARPAAAAAAAPPAPAAPVPPAPAVDT